MPRNGALAVARTIAAADFEAVPGCLLEHLH
jgi:hypothetical protein